MTIIGETSQGAAACLAVEGEMTIYRAAELRDLIEVEIVGHHFTVKQLREFDQLHVDFANIREILFDDLHIQVRHLLNALQDVESAPAAVASASPSTVLMR